MPNWHAARLLRVGLALWVAAIIVATLLTIQVTLVLRNWFWLNDHGYRPWIRRSVNAWQYGSDLASVVSIAGMVVVAAAILRRPDRSLRRAACLLIALPVVAHSAILAYDYVPGALLPTTPSMTAAVGPALAVVVVRSAYWILFWYVIFRSVDRESRGRVWWALAIALVGVLSLIAFAAPSWYHHAFFRFCTTSSWRDHPWQVDLPWTLPDEWVHVFQGAAYIVILAGLIPFIRLLNATRRAAGYVEEG